MSVFVTGATGTLGVPTVRLLVRTGHRVRALARSSASASRIAELGAEPVFASLDDPVALAGAVRGASAVVHLATRIPPLAVSWRRSAWRENDRLRRDGTRHLVDAALAEGVPAVVYPSFAPVYADGGDRWLAVGDPVDATEVLVSTLDAEREVSRFTSAGGRGVALRLAGVYGPHSAATQDVLALAARGISGFCGPARAYQPLIWDEDAAAALVAAVETAGLTGTFDVADDEPLTRADLAVALAAAVGRSTVHRPPTPVVRAALGERMGFLLRSQRVSNRRFRAATGWQPRVPDVTVGLGRLRQLPVG